MIKKLLITSVAVCTAITSFAQKSAKDEGIRTVITGVNAENAKVAALQCDTIYNFNPSAPTTTMTMYSLNTNSACTTGGYLLGNNCYGDKEKANYFTGASYSALTSPSVTSCFVFFFKNPTSGRGTKGVPTNTVGLKVYSGTLAGGPTPTTSIGMTTAPIGSIVAAFTSTVSSLGQFRFDFATPVAVTAGGFFTSIVMPTALGDTIALFQQFSAANNSAWDKDVTNAWTDMFVGWGLKTEICMFPVMGCSGIVGLKENELNAFFNVVPNPSNGVFSLVASLSDLTFDYTVTNSIGQVVTSKKNVKGGSVSDINLSEVASGLYFVNVISGNNTITKKLIINK